MSDWVRIHFKEIPKGDLLDYCISLSRNMVSSAEEIIKKNIYYIPSIRLCANFDTDLDYKANWREADRNWLYHLFSIHIVYWEKYNLLGVIGETPENMSKEFVTIEFQNSTDQNYDYNEWSGISYFENVVKRLEHADANMVSSYGYDIDDINKDIDYFRKTAVYSTIHKELDIHNWLWKREGNFRTFSLQSINDDSTFFSLALKLEAIRENSLIP